MLFVGDDWAEDHHDVEIQDQNGKRLAKARLPEGIAGITRFHDLIGRFLPEDSGPEQVKVGPGGTFVGDGAVLYRTELEARGAEIPADDDSRHIPWARHTAALAKDFGPADGAEPIYLRVPDAEKALKN